MAFLPLSWLGCAVTDPSYRPRGQEGGRRQIVGSAYVVLWGRSSTLSSSEGSCAFQRVHVWCLCSVGCLLLLGCALELSHGYFHQHLVVFSLFL